MSTTALFKYQGLPVNLDETKAKNAPIDVTGGSGKVVLRLYPMSVICDNLQRTSVTLRRWERQGMFPKATFRIRNHRYYTKSQIQLFLFLFYRHNLHNVSDNVGKPIPQEFIDSVFKENSELMKFTLMGLSKQDIVPKKAGK